MGRATSEPDWKELLSSWDRQQESFNPDRERRFGFMFDALEVSLPHRFTALDLGSGPGSLSARLLRRFPGGRVVAVDYDPVTRRIGQGALGRMGGRLTWVDAKLGAPGWVDRLPPGSFDAALSTTALHWLTPRGLRSLYRDLGRRLRRGGIFLNGDYLPWGPTGRSLDRLADRMWKLRVREWRRGKPGGEWGAWEKWWESVEKMPALRPEFEERKRRAAGHPKHTDLSLRFHENALKRAGFRDVAVLSQDLGSRVLYARR